VLKLSAKAIKTTLVIDPAGLLAATLPPAVARIPFAISVGSRTIRGELNAKSLRRAIAALEAGECAVIVQGKLESDDVLTDAGISAMPKSLPRTGSGVTKPVAA
jgi:hypothetical protein